MTKDDSFEPLALNARKYRAKGKSLYRVYSNEKDSQLVEADNAALAVVESGVKKAFRVVRQDEAMLASMPMEALEPQEEQVLTNIESQDERPEFISISIADIHPKEKDGFAEMTWDAMHPKVQDEASAAPLSE